MEHGGRAEGSDMTSMERSSGIDCYESIYYGYSDIERPDQLNHGKGSRLRAVKPSGHGGWHGRAKHDPARVEGQC